MRSAHNPGPTTDQEALQEEFLGALQALAGSAGNGRRMELLSWEEAPYEAVKACLLASGRVPAGRGGSVSLADGAGDEGAGGSASEPARSMPMAGSNRRTPRGAACLK
jgi:type I restriction enzyme M protein